VDGKGDAVTEPQGRGGFREGGGGERGVWHGKSGAQGLRAMARGPTQRVLNS
jgi:hypothetical protein